MSSLWILSNDVDDNIYDIKYLAEKAACAHILEMLRDSDDNDNLPIAININSAIISGAYKKAIKIYNSEWVYHASEKIEPRELATINQVPDLEPLKPDELLPICEECGESETAQGCACCENCGMFACQCCSACGEADCAGPCSACDECGCEEDCCCSDCGETSCDGECMEEEEEEEEEEEDDYDDEDDWEDDEDDEDDEEDDC